jgi:hypothetical protein
MEYLFLFLRSLNGADFRALRRLEEPGAFGAFLRINYKDVITLGDSLIGAFGFTGSATDTIFSDIIGHYTLLV